MSLRPPIDWRRIAAAALAPGIAATLLGSLIVPAARAATMQSQTASLGPVSATVTYDSVSSGALPYSSLHLSIARAGTPL